MERYEEALQDFNRAVELDPKLDWATASRGETYRLMERYEEALQDFNRAIELNPKYDWAIASRGLTYLFMKRYEEALQDFNRAIELDPDDWWFYNRAITHKVMGQLEQAQTDLNQALSLAQTAYTKEPENWDITFNLALYYLAANKDEQAKHYYRDALRRVAPIPDIQFALQDLEDFLMVFPNDRLGRLVQQVLQKRLAQ
jgi:tetratricopeptide (TPR) repeat protein